MTHPPSRLRKGEHAPPDIALRPTGSAAKGSFQTADPARIRAERRGRWAEGYAGFRLRLAGWRILARRARTPFGEIDCIARRGRTLAFIEIKARADWAAAETAISPRQQERIAQAAEHWLGRAVARRPDLAHHEHRFDAVLVVGWRLRHIADAWRQRD